MLDDAGRLKDFEAVLCWDQDRFGRFDPLEAGYWVKPLRDADVRLETIAQGRIDWNDFAGRIIYAVQQEGKHAFLRDLSRNTLRGHLAAAREGAWQGGPAPYGYAAAGGKLVLGDPEKVEVVRWLFHSYATSDVSVRTLARTLNGRGLVGPGGGRWYDNTVYKILTRPTYTGRAVWNRRQDGKYYGVAGGEVTARVRGGKRRHLPEGEWVGLPDAHPAVIDRETFDRVQERLKANRSHTTPHRGGGDFLFSRLLVCGNCGARMIGSSRLAAADPEGRPRRRYVCANYHHHGSAACTCNTLSEEPLLRAVVRRVTGWFRDAGNRSALEAELRRQLDQAPAAVGGAGRAATLRSCAAELERQIGAGAGRLLTVPEDLADVVAGKLRQWQEERARVLAELDAAERAARDRRDVGADLGKALRVLDSLEKVIHKAPPAAARELLRQVVAHVECRFDRVPMGKRRVRGRFSRGVVAMRRDLIVKHATSDRPLMRRFRAGNRPGNGSWAMLDSVSSAPDPAVWSASPLCSGG